MTHESLLERDRVVRVNGTSPRQQEELAALRAANQKIFEAYSEGTLSAEDVNTIRSGRHSSPYGRPVRGGT